MKITNIKIVDSIDSDTMGDRDYRIKFHVYIEFHIEGLGVLRIYAKPGARTNGRSGGPLVDPLFPNWGTQLERAVVLMHDALYYDFDISFEMANKLLKAGIRYLGRPVAAQLVYLGVSTPIARKAYGCKTEKERKMKAYYNVQWDSK
jgi:hypothetical protein